MTAARARVGAGLLAAAGPLPAAATAGLIGGVVIGGIGGRLAMLVLRLTSDPGLHGLETDDGFTIGVVSVATAFLVMVAAFAGVVGGLVYLAVRSWLPRRSRPWLFGALTGLLGGALAIRPGGIDFTRLEPRWLAVAMFVALPAAYGVVVSLLVERFLGPTSAFRSSRVSLLGLAFLLPIPLFGMGGIGIVVLAAASLLVWHAAPRLASAWSSSPAIWAGRSLLLVVAGAAAVALGRDLVAVF